MWGWGRGSTSKESCDAPQHLRIKWSSDRPTLSECCSHDSTGETLTPLVPLSLRADKGEGEIRTEARIGVERQCGPLVQY